MASATAGPNPTQIEPMTNIAIATIGLLAYIVKPTCALAWIVASMANAMSIMPMELRMGAIAVATSRIVVFIAKKIYAPT
jgi:hypothetical protein